jgi:flagellar assembly protein FliH
MDSSKPAAKSSAHSRFIPREEIGDVAKWHFSAIGGATEPAPLEAVIEDKPVDTMHPQALHDAREEAFAEGYAKGHETGAQEVREALTATAQKQTEEMAGRMAQLLKTMTEELLDKEQDMARQLLVLACEIARQVVRQEIKTNPDLLRPLIGEALEMIVEDGLPATIRMNPDDLARMHDALAKTLGENAPEFVGDPQIAQGGCVVQSPSTSADATIEKRWARAVGNLGLNIAWKSEASHD